MLTTNAAAKDTAAAHMISDCQDSITNASYYNMRGGVDGDYWPGSAVKCAFAYLTTQNAQYLTNAIKFWQASLNDDQNIGDNLGCTANVNTNWQSWDGSSDPRPPVIITVTHDTGYPMRWYGPDIALTYDWLSGAPGVSSALLAQTRTCLTAWIDYYTKEGYHADEAGANYNAGYVLGKTLAAIAIGNDGGADGHLWTETVDTLFPNLIIGQGLLGASGTVGQPAGPIVGGDWAEGWQYGPLSVLEYSLAARVLEEQGVALPDMDDWTNSLAVRIAYGTTPTNDGQFQGIGDFDSPMPNQVPNLTEVDAVLAGPSSDQAASWVTYMKQAQMLTPSSPFIYDAFAELRTVAPQDFRAQTPPPSLWYVARGTRAMYVRTGWDANAFWGVFTSTPQIVSDHEHFAASNFIFTRGADQLVVDPSPYGEDSTLMTNAVTADSPGVIGDYAPSQTPWSKAELLWARGSESGVFAARSDFAQAFIFADTPPSDIPYAHREWVMFPEGEIVTVDRVKTADASHYMYVGYHTNTNGTLKPNGNVAVGTVGGSQVAIHQIMLSGGTANISMPPVADCGSMTWGMCPNARFPVDYYQIKVPGPFAVAIHAIDGLDASEAPAITGSLNDDNFDPAPKMNTGVIGAAVYRGSKQSYVVASSAALGASSDPMVYGVPGGSAGRHIVFDAPEDANGKSTVTAAVQSDRCVVTIDAGDGFAGRPLMFSVAAAADGCTVAEDVDVATGSVPPGGGLTGGGGTGGGIGVNNGTTKGGCSCATADGRPSAALLVLFVGALGATLARVRSRPGRRLRRR